MHFTYNEKVEWQQKRSDTEPTKAVASHSYSGGIPASAEPVVGSGTSTTSDFVFENIDERWPERRKS